MPPSVVAAGTGGIEQMIGKHVFTYAFEIEPSKVECVKEIGVTASDSIFAHLSAFTHENRVHVNTWYLPPHLCEGRDEDDVITRTFCFMRLRVDRSFGSRCKSARRMRADVISAGVRTSTWVQYVVGERVA